MIQEYLNRTFFVCLHGGLLSLYLILFLRSYAQLRRERKTLRRLAKSWTEGTDEAKGKLANLKNALEIAPPTILRRQLQSVVGTTTAGEDFDSQRVLGQFGQSLIALDDLIRFCINGLVIVGLMGTLYAFYQMWGTRGTTNLTEGNSTIYLESMSTALLVSLVGLMLALVTNFLFSFLRARRQALLDELATFLVPFAGLVPTDAKTHVLLTNLMAPLSKLVEQISWQNEHVVQVLIHTVTSRTEQLSGLISKTTTDWQTLIDLLRTETLTAVSNLVQTTNHLSAASENVAGTMQQVSEALDRTKSIGQIVEQIQSSSSQVITSLSTQLSSATDEWIAVQKLAADSYQATLQQQSETASAVSSELSTALREDFKQLIADALADIQQLKDQMAAGISTANEQVSTTLQGFSGIFVTNMESVSAKWQTEATAVTDKTIATMDKLVNDWNIAVQGTAQNITTSLAGSRESLSAMAAHAAAFTGDLQKLQAQAHQLSENSSAPHNLAETTDRLGQICEALTALSARVDYGKVLNRMDESLVVQHNEMTALKRHVEQLNGSQPENHGVATRLNRLDERFDGIDTKLTALGEAVRRLPAKVKPSPSPTVMVEPTPPPTRWQRFRARFARSPKSAFDTRLFAAEEAPPTVDDESKPEEDTQRDG